MMNTPSSTHFKKSASMATLASLLAIGAAACSEQAEVELPEEDTVEMTVAGDGDWIRIDGEVVSTTAGSPSSFVLDYGTDSVTVEADDWDWASDGIALLPGDRVSVTGRVDEGLFNTETIEAGAIYVRNLNTVFYASPADEEELGLAAAPMRPVTDGVDYTGWVTGKSGNTFTLGAGPTMITVNTENLDTSYSSRSVDTGDRVYVWGDLTIGGNGGSQLTADGLLELTDGAGDAAQTPSSESETDGAEPTMEEADANAEP
ncbi:hypothetical protein [Qipengyuania sp. 902]|uniref:hypothetical protein n=1 Tax=Qipengyuania sp. 902 TaxID=3417565 RepID=UPI003EBECC00